MKKHGFPQPDGTIAFEVKKSDTLVSIAAQRDISVGLLKKINRLMSENIFAGQVLYVPGPDYVQLNFAALSSHTEKSPSVHSSSARTVIRTPTLPESPCTFSVPLSTSPMKSVPGHARRQSTPETESVTLPRALSDDEVKKIDEECYQRFVKMDAKYIEPKDEEVPGVLLVTPDALLFDANDSHPLVYRNGREAYQFMTSILNITLVTVYHGTTTLNFGRCPYNETDVIIQSDVNDNASNRNRLSQVISDDSTKDSNLQFRETSRIDSMMSDSCREKLLSDAKFSKEEVTGKGYGAGDNLFSRFTPKENADRESAVELKSVTGGQYYNTRALDDDPARQNTVPTSNNRRAVSNAMEDEIVSWTENKDIVAEDQSTVANQKKRNDLLNFANESRLSSGEAPSSQFQSSNRSLCLEKGKCRTAADLKTQVTVFLCVKVDRSVDAVKGFCSDSPPTGGVQGLVKSEYWYSIPCDKADLLYAFFMQWVAEDGSKGFIVSDIDSTVEYKKYSTVDGQKLVCEIIKDWELWSCLEYRRMKSEEEIKRLPLPELSESSSILGTSHVSMLIRHLPPIAEGSPWRLVYSTSKHGFSLSTLYRKMNNVDSPVFLIVQDVNDQVFGALMSCTLKMSDHFYGSGESYLFTFYPEFKKYGWTGLNSFFVKGDKDSLAIGAGKGSNGLWLDGNLYHGRTQQCQTFENELLTISQDFTIKCLETWCFA